MKSNSKVAARQDHLPAGKPAAADFKLDDWQGPSRRFRFVGWRDDHSALFVFDDRGCPLVIKPALFKPESPIHFPEPPTAIRKIRLIPPPCRQTRTEAKLLAGLWKLPKAGDCTDFDDATRLYCREALKRRINFQPPEPWEMVYGDALAPDSCFQTAVGTQSMEEKCKRNLKWRRVQDNLILGWAKSNGLTLKGMTIAKAEFLRRFASYLKDQMSALAQIYYKMEFAAHVPVWLTGYVAPHAPQSVADLDQVRKLLETRPELVRLSPEDAEKVLGRKPDKKHRILRQYCRIANLSHKSLTRADLPALTAVRKERRDSQSRGAIKGNKQRIEK